MSVQTPDGPLTCYHDAFHIRTIYPVSDFSHVCAHCKQMLILDLSCFLKGRMTHCSTSLCLGASVWDLTSSWI